MDISGLEVLGLATLVFLAVGALVLLGSTIVVTFANEHKILNIYQKLDTIDYRLNDYLVSMANKNHITALQQQIDNRLNDTLVSMANKNHITGLQQQIDILDKRVESLNPKPKSKKK